jgi:hypothetical protein
MNVSELYKRDIRIEGKPDNKPMGYMTKVTDIETGEMVPGVKSATVYLNAASENKAVLTYYKLDAHGKYIFDNGGEPVEKTVTVDNPEVSVTAMEQITYAYVLQAFALYADKIERDTESLQVPALTLYSDGTGKVHDVMSDTAYLFFTDLHALLTKLRGK